MKKLRIMLATTVCKLLITAGRLAGKKGSYTPGVVAMKIYPDILRHLSEQVKKDIIFVCGTNGKTTTNNLICSLLEKSGQRVVCNKVGANMLAGVTCAFAEKASFTGHLNADYASIECDEASLRHAVKHVRADKVVITNLFRDQLDRYGEIESTIGLFNEAFEKTEKTTLVLNADDPMSAHFGLGRKAVYYGINQICNNGGQETNEGKFCTVCGAPLEYDFYHYSQLGKWHCSVCENKRPEPDYSADNIVTDGKLAFDINGKVHLDLNYRGFYNVYNILAAYSVYDILEFDSANVNKILGEYKPQIGRMEPFSVNGKLTVLNLAKNPAGFNQAIATLVDDGRSKDVLVAVNDRPSDGMDISWLYDVDFERLADADVKQIYVSGERRFDLALRLKYAGFKNVTVTDITADTLRKIASGDGEVCYLLVNYTVLFGTQNILKSISDKGEANQ